MCSAFRFYSSTDGGKTFRVDQASGRARRPARAVDRPAATAGTCSIGTDGGFYVTYDRMANWDHLTLAALGQFYHVAVDNRKPYRVYGGLQDNGSWGGPSRTLRNTGPINEDWFTVERRRRLRLPRRSGRPRHRVHGKPGRRDRPA